MPRSKKVIIGPLKKGELTKYGYSVKKSSEERRRSIDRAVKKYGPTSTLRKLNALAVLSKNRSPKNSAKYRSDVRYIQKTYYSKKINS